MAKELDEKLLVSIEVSQAKMMKQLDKLATQVAKAAKGYEDKFRSANKGVEQSANQAATALERINKITGVDRSGFSKDRAADVAEYGRELDRLRAKYNPLFAASKQYESELDELNRALQLGAINADEHGAALTRLNSRYQSMATQASVTSKMMRANRFETANIAAQLNDIGVQLAGGQSPFLIAIQQGTQLNQILGTAGGLRASVSLLGGAFASLVNPISLATIAIIGLGGAATQYFLEALRGGEKTEESLKTQQALIKRVADRWGEAFPALKQYVDQLEREQELSERAQANQKLIEEAWGGVRAQIDGLVQSSEDLLSTLLFESSLPVQQIDAIRNAVQNLEGKVREGTATTDDARRVQQALAEVLDSSANPAVADLAAQFDNLAAAIAGASNEAVRVQDQLFEGIEATLAGIDAANEKFIADQERKNNLTAEQLRLENEIARVREEAERAGGSLDPETAERLARETLAAEDRRDARSRPARRSSGSRGSSVSTIDRERDAVKELIESLEFERSLIGLSNVEREKAIALRRAGSAATAEDREAIGQNIEALHREREAFEQLQDAIEQSRQASEYLNQVLEQGILDAIPAIKTGNDALDNLLNTLVKLTAQAVLFGNGPLAGLFGGGFGLFGGGSSFIPTPGVGLFAKGGIAAHGKARPLPTFSRGGISKSAAIFGEAGPEAAVPLPDGRRIPVDLRMPQGGASSGASYAPTYNIDASGSSNPEQTRAVVTQALKEYDKGNYQRWLAAQGQARKRNAV